MNEQTWEGKRMHPLWIPFSMGRSIKEMIVPFLYFIVLKFNSESFFVKVGTIIVIGYLLYRFIANIFYWKNFRYTITDEEVKINEGRLRTKKRYIALERIQSVQQNTTFFHKIVGLTSLTMLTGTTDDNSSVKLEMITPGEAAAIQAQLAEHPGMPTEETENRMDKPVPDEHIQQHYVISKKEIVQAAFTSFAFLAFIAILFTIYVKVDEVYPLDDKFVALFDSIHVSWMLVTGISIVLLALSSLSGIFYIYIRYGNFQVQSDNRRIYIEKGVFQRTHFSIPKARINAIKFNKTFIRRWFGIAEVELISAGSVEDEDTETNILFPFISEKRAKELVPEILPAFDTEGNMTKLPRIALWPNLIRTGYMWAMVTIIVVLFFPDQLYLSLIALVVIGFIRILDMFHSRHALNGSFIQIRSGAFSSELFITTRKKIAELEVNRSLLQRWFGLSAFTISTRAKPIQSAGIGDIPKEEAFTYYDWYAIPPDNHGTAESFQDDTAQPPPG